MLTNKKKGIVRSLALVLAALMVFAMCLTSCTDATAQAAADAAKTAADGAQTAADAAKTAADGAQATATAAKNAADAAKAAADAAKAAADGKTTADAVAAQITAALAPYLKTADAMTEAKVNELIAAKVKDFATKNDIKDFATKANLDALKNSLSAYVKTDALNSAIDTAVKAALADYATVAALQDYLKKTDAVTMDMIKDFLEDNGYMTKDDVEEYLNTTLANYFGTLTPAEVLDILTAAKDMIADQDTMSKEDWEKATYDILDAISTIQGMIADFKNYTYLDATAEEINKLLSLEIPNSDPAGAPRIIAVTPFVKGTDGHYAYVDVSADVVKLLEYALLRAATPATIADYLAHVKEADAQLSMQDELLVIVNRLYALGTNMPVKGATDKATTYHGAAFTKETVQVVTLTGTTKADFDKINVDLDAILVKYALEGKGNLKSAEVLYVYTDTDNTVATAPVVNKDKVAQGVMPTAPANHVYTPQYMTFGYNHGSQAANTIYAIDSDAAFASVNDFMTAPALTDKIVTYTGSALDPDTAYDQTVKTDLGVAAGANGSKILNVNGLNVDATYKAIYQQLVDCQNAVNTANATFEKFLKETVNGGADLKDVTDETLIGKLTADMCERPTKADTTYDSKGGYLLEGSKKNITAAVNINGGSEEGITRFELYKQMSKSYTKKAFEKYQAYALNLLDKILNDYQAIVKEAEAIQEKAGGAGKVCNTTAVLDDAAILTALNIKDATKSSGAAFLKAFFNDGGDFTWAINPNATNSDSDVVNKYVALASYYTNNKNAAYDANGQITSDVVAAIAKNATDLSVQLASATIYARTQISSLKYEDLTDTEKLSPYTAYITRLQEAVRSLDEMIFRTIYGEVKKAYINDAYAAISETSGMWTDGIVKYYCGADNAELKKLLQYYLTGYCDVDTDSVATGMQNAAPAGTEFVAVMLNEMNGHQLGYIIPAIKVGHEGKDMMDAAQKTLDKCLATMENMAIKANFVKYLDNAKSELYHAYISYYSAVNQADAAVALDRTQINKLTQAYNEKLTALTIEEYKESHGGIELDQYKAKYQVILNIVINKDSTYFAVINNDYATLKKDIKSTVEVLWDHDGDAKTNPVLGIPSTYVQPDDIYVAGDHYIFVGSAAVAFDAVLNPSLY